MSTSFDPVVSSNFGTAIIKSFEGEAKAVAKARAFQDSCIQKMLDAFWVACGTTKAEFLKGNAATNPARFQVKGVFDTLAEKGFISKSSAASYQSAFWIAFEQGIPFQRDLNNKKTAEKQAASEGPAMPKAGTSTQTNRNELDKTLTKALAQARLLGLTEFAADMLDLCLERLDNFQETVLAKK